jgi:hypothetical protein
MKEEKSFVNMFKDSLKKEPKVKESKNKESVIEEKSFVDMFKDGMKKDAKNRVKNNVTVDSHASDDTHVFDRMADVMYGLTTKMPLVGQYAKVPLDDINALKNTKLFTSKVFKPIFPFFKVDKKYTKFFVNEAPKDDKES